MHNAMIYVINSSFINNVT